MSPLAAGRAGVWNQKPEVSYAGDTRCGGYVFVCIRDCLVVSHITFTFKYIQFWVI